jgi:phospholipase C
MRIYRGDIPQSLVLSHQRGLGKAWHYYRMGRFFADAGLAEADFPQYVFIEPTYYLSGQNDDHPPHSTQRAQALIASVYNALRANEPLWNSTLLVVLYDEHGGFYDHVSPPAAVPPGDSHTEYNFNRFGVRVPAVLVSPWVERGVEKTQFDHTSILKYAIERWQLQGLTDRVASANSIGSVLRTSGTPRSDTPPSITMPSEARMMMATPRKEPPLNENQKALLELSHFLESEIDGPARPSLMMAAGPGPYGQGQLADERVEHFIEQQRAKAVAAGMAPPTAR